MRHEVIYYTLQPKTEHTFWVNHIKTGLFEAAKDRQCICHMLSPDGDCPSRSVNGQPVLVVGNEDSWLTNTARRLTAQGAHSIIVNGSMQDAENTICSGVVFELKKAIEDALRHLTFSGRKRVALLGVNPRSVSDLSKCKAFSDPENIFWAHGELELCVLDFIATFRQQGYDAVICANDTVAICLMMHMLQAQFKLPDDLYIVGMGNSCIGATLPVPLTSIDFDYCQMGKAAVKLLCYLKENPDCGRLVSYLPCRLIIRQSAPLQCFSADLPGTDAPPQPASTYFGGIDARNIVRAEAIMQSADATDRAIILGLLNGKSAEALSQTLYLSTRAVRYRITNLVKKHGFSDKSEFLQTLYSGFYLDGGEPKP